MKLFFISDIHGSVYWLNKAIKKFEDERADHIILLGDLLYHGPRNPLPREYDPKSVASTLNRYKDKIVAVRGNCDAEVDQMMLEFPVLSDYTVIFYEGIRIFATHGHKFGKEFLSNISENDVFIQGHTHIPVADEISKKHFLNPGSITLPKENNANTYAVLEDEEFKIKDFEGAIIKTKKIL